jgi:hypothetical protein
VNQSSAPEYSLGFEDRQQRVYNERQVNFQDTTSSADPHAPAFQLLVLKVDV